MSFINNVLSRINMAEFLAMISKWWTCIIDSACALYILKKSRINIVRLFWIRAQSYVGILKMYCTFVFGLCIINPVTSMDHSTFEKCTCIINPACPFCHLHHFWRNLVPPVNCGARRAGRLRHAARTPATGNPHPRAVCQNSPLGHACFTSGGSGGCEGMVLLKGRWF